MSRDAELLERLEIDALEAYGDDDADVSIEEEIMEQLQREVDE